VLIGWRVRIRLKLLDPDARSEKIGASHTPGLKDSHWKIVKFFCLFCLNPEVVTIPIYKASHALAHRCVRLIVYRFDK
jgi:hypothetical protein